MALVQIFRVRDGRTPTSATTSPRIRRCARSGRFFFFLCIPMHSGAFRCTRPGPRFIQLRSPAGMNAHGRAHGRVTSVGGLVEGAALLLAKQGMQATSFSEVLKATGAPTGDPPPLPRRARTAVGRPWNCGGRMLDGLPAGGAGVVEVTEQRDEHRTARGSHRRGLPSPQRIMPDYSAVKRHPATAAQGGDQGHPADDQRGARADQRDRAAGAGEGQVGRGRRRRRRAGRRRRRRRGDPTSTEDGEGDADGDTDGDVDGLGHGPVSAMQSLAPWAL